MRWIVGITGAAAVVAAGWLLYGRGGGEAPGLAGRRAGPPEATLEGPPEAPGDDLPPSDRLALLVGIDRYPEGLPPLNGCVRDVERAAALLRDRFGFEQRDVLVLRDEEATHEAIVKAFSDFLIGRARADSEVVFWFSGHGSTVPDEDERREADDSTFLAWDSRSGKRLGEYDLVDDEMNALLRVLTGITSRVVMITDSCHSGGGFRGGGRPIQPRGVPKGLRPLQKDLVAPFWPPGVELKTGSLGGDAYVHLAACSPEELAYEYAYPDENGVWVQQGLLSYFLADALERCRPGITWRRLADEVSQRILGERTGQTVWAEGALDRVAFGGAFEEHHPGFLGRVVGDRVILEGGRVHRLRPGSELEVWDNLSTEADVLGTIVLEEAGGVRSRGKWVGEPPDLEHVMTVRARETLRPGGSDPLSVFVEDDEVAALLPADLAVRVHEPGLAGAFLRSDEAGELELFDFHGHRIWTSSDLDRARGSDVRLALEQEIRDELEWRSLMTLVDDPGDLALEARFVEPQEVLEDFRQGHPPLSKTLPVAVDGKGPAGVTSRVTGGPSRDDYRLAQLDVTNRASEPVHVFVLSLPESRGPEIIWPGSAKQDNVIQPGATEPIGVGLVIPPDWDLERPMRDRYLVIATRDWADFSIFERRKTRGPGGDVSTLPVVVRRALEGPRTRGITRPRPPPKDLGFGILAVDVLVERELKE